ncbi:hypothetical protein GJ496_008129 [Pomphorhynchus laevis]|nr:hypothetical protein GJ496_008129 [Pomphorhynchus laevis]
MDIYEILIDDIWTAFVEICNSITYKYSRIYTKYDSFYGYVAVQLPEIPNHRRMRIMMATNRSNIASDHVVYIHHWKLPSYKKGIAQHPQQILYHTRDYYLDIKAQKQQNVIIDNSGFCSKLKFNDTCGQFKDCGGPFSCRNGRCECYNLNRIPVRNGTYCEAIPPGYKSHFDRTPKGYRHLRIYRKVFMPMICNRPCNETVSCPKGMNCILNKCRYHEHQQSPLWRHFKRIRHKTVKIHGFNESCNEFKECDNNFICLDNTCQCSSKDYLPVKSGTICAQRILTILYDGSYDRTGYSVFNNRIRKSFPNYVCKKECNHGGDCPDGMYCDSNSKCVYGSEPISFLWNEHIPIPANAVRIHGINESCDEFKECDNNFICQDRICQCPSNEYFAIKNGTICVQRSMTNVADDSYIPSGYMVTNLLIRKKFPNYICNRQCTFNDSCPASMYCKDTLNCVYSLEPENYLWADYLSISSNIVNLHVLNESCGDHKYCDNNFTCIANKCQCLHEFLPANNGTTCVPRPLLLHQSKYYVVPGYFNKDLTMYKSFPLYVCKKSCLSNHSCPGDMHCDNRSVCSYYIGSNIYHCPDNKICPIGMFCLNQVCNYGSFHENVSWAVVSHEGHISVYNVYWYGYRHLWIVFFLTLLTTLIWQMWRSQSRPLYFAIFLDNVEIIDGLITNSVYAEHDSDLDSFSDSESYEENNKTDKRQYQYVGFLD